MCGGGCGGRRGGGCGGGCGGGGGGCGGGDKKLHLPEKDMKGCHQGMKTNQTSVQC